MSKSKFRPTSPVSAPAAKPEAQAAPVEIAHAATIPPPAPAVVDAVPAARPSWEDFRAAAELGAFVDARLTCEDVPQLRAGVVLYGDVRRFSLSMIAEFGESHLRALSTDPDIEARIVFPEQA